MRRCSLRAERFCWAVVSLAAGWLLLVALLPLLSPKPPAGLWPEGAAVGCSRLVQRQQVDVAQLVCADAAVQGVPAALWQQLEHGDAVVATADGWQRRPAGMAAAARLALGLPLPLNCASAPLLAQLPGVSPRAAAALVAYRHSHGPFVAFAQLTAVPFVGAKTQAQLAEATHLGEVCYEADEPPAGAWHGENFSVKESMVQREWLVDVVARLPQGLISRLWGVITRLRWPRFAVRALQEAFINGVGINMAEAELPLQDYGSLEDLFVRRLKPGMRPIDAEPTHLISPVDARVGAMGVVEDGTMLQIKGRSYSLARLLGDAEKARAYEGGSYVTFYLAPKDYHLIHAPAAGHVFASRLIPGSLMPVFEESLAKVDELFCRNERIISYLRSPDAGDLAVVKVGATLVGRIRAAYDSSLQGNVSGQRMRYQRYDKPAWLERGDVLGAFELGSTVVLVAPPGKIALDALPWGSFVQMGQRIGRMLGTPRGRDVGGAPSVVWQPHDGDDDT